MPQEQLSLLQVDILQIACRFESDVDTFFRQLAEKMKTASAAVGPDHEAFLRSKLIEAVYHQVHHLEAQKTFSEYL